MQPFAKLTPELLGQLSDIVGRENVITDREKLLPYSHDELPGVRYHTLPDAALKSGSTEEVAAIMSLANSNLLPVTPRGAGTGLCGGAVPLCGGIVLSLERMNQILEYDKANLPGLLKTAYRTAASLGGTISGEHGIGAKRKNYLPVVLGETEITLMRQIKSVFDPQGILNPGKVLP